MANNRTLVHGTRESKEILLLDNIDGSSSATAQISKAESYAGFSKGAIRLDATANTAGSCGFIVEFSNDTIDGWAENEAMLNTANATATITLSANGYAYLFFQNEFYAPYIRISASASADGSYSATLLATTD